MSHQYEHARGEVVADVPLWLAFDIWTRPSALPRFLSGVQHVEPLDDSWCRWHVDLGEGPTVCHVETTDHVAHRLLAWRSEDGPWHLGRVTFEGPHEGPTTVRYELTWRAERCRSAAVRARLDADLRRFAVLAHFEALTDLTDLSGDLADDLTVDLSSPRSAGLTEASSGT